MVLQEDGEAGGAVPQDDAAAAAAQGLNANAIRQNRRACIGLCMVLLLKRFLVQAYHVQEEMLQTYNPALKKCASPGSHAYAAHADTRPRYPPNAAAHISCAADLGCVPHFCVCAPVCGHMWPHKRMAAVRQAAAPMLVVRLLCV